MLRKRKKKRSSKEIREQLEKIYAQKDGKIPDLTHLDKRQSSKMTNVLLKVIAVLIVLSAAAWIGFFLWTQALFQEGDDLSILIEGPQEVVAGEEVYYTIRYENLKRVDLEQMTLALNLPETFSLTSASPEFEKEFAWNIDTLSSQSDGAIIIGGTFRSEVGTQETLQALFTYRPSNTHSNFQAIETIKVNVEESMLEIALTGPETALSGDEVSYVINVQNTSSEESILAGIQAILPETFQISSTDPELASEDEVLWSFDTIASDELVVITINGQYTAEAEGTETIEAKALFLQENDKHTTQAQSDVETEVLAGTLAFHFIMNGSAEGQVVDLGESMRISIDYENTGPETINDLVFTLEIETKDDLYSPVDWTNARIGEASRSGRVLTWDGDAVDDFSSLASGESGVLDLTLPLYTYLDPDEADQFIMYLNVKIGEAGSLSSGRSIDASPISIAINSDLELSATTHYYDDDGTVVGSGALPLEADEQTTFMIFWDLTNSLHDLEDVTVSTILPSHVIWEEDTQADIGTLSYNTVTRMVTWSIDSLPSSITQAEASFELGVSPTTSDVGSFVKLTNEMSLSATDMRTESSITSTSTFLSTDLSSDDFAEESGVVVE